MLTLDWIEALTPSFRISKSVALGLNNFASARDTTDEIALELLRPYPEGISVFTEILILFLSSSDFGIDASTTFWINLALRFDSLFSKKIPLPDSDSTSASIPSEIPRVAPFPVA